MSGGVGGGRRLLCTEKLLRWSPLESTPHSFIRQPNPFPMSRIAIVGAGVAGLTTAFALRTLPVDVTVFEKSRGYGGRAATRGRYGCRYDHGANYFAPSSERGRRLVTAHLPSEDLVDIGRPIWHFDSEGALSRPAPTEDHAPKWTYRQGISRLGKLLARYSRAEIHRNTRIRRLRRRGERWHLQSEEGASFSAFEAVVLTPPAPQTADLLARSTGGGAQLDRIQRAVADVSYTAQFSYVFSFDRALSRPGAFYGARALDGQHPLAWIGFEHDKPGHVKTGHSMVVAQTAPPWTAPRVDRDPDRFVPEVKEWAEDILVCDLRHPEWYDTQRWRYARPTGALDEDVRAAGADLGLVLAGDYVAGTGRVGAAIETGFDAAQQVWARR